MIQAEQGHFSNLKIEVSSLGGFNTYPQVIAQVTYTTPYFEKNINLELVFSLTPSHANPQPFIGSQGFERQAFIDFVELFLQETVEKVLIEKVVDTQPRLNIANALGFYTYQVAESLQGKCILPVGVNTLNFVGKKEDPDTQEGTSDASTVDHLVAALKSLNCAVVAIPFEKGHTQEKERTQTYLDRVVKDAKW